MANYPNDRSDMPRPRLPDREPTMFEPTSFRPLFAIAPLIFFSGAALADPPGLKTLPIGADAPDFRLPGVDGKTYTPQGLRRRQGPGRRSSPATTARPPRPTRTGSPGCTPTTKDKGVAVVAISPNDPPRRPARRAGLHRPRRLVRGHEDPRQGPQVRLSRTSTTARPRRRRRPTACSPRRTSTSSTPTASSATSAGSTTRR